MEVSACGLEVRMWARLSGLRSGVGWLSVAIGSSRIWRIRVFGDDFFSSLLLLPFSKTSLRISFALITVREG